MTDERSTPETPPPTQWGLYGIAIIVFAVLMAARYAVDSVWLSAGMTALAFATLALGFYYYKDSSANRLAKCRVFGLLLALAAVGLIWRSACIYLEPPKIGMRFVRFSTNAAGEVNLALRITNGAPSPVNYLHLAVENVSDTRSWEHVKQEVYDDQNMVIRAGGDLLFTVTLPSATSHCLATVYCGMKGGPLTKWFNEVIESVCFKLEVSAYRLLIGRSYKVELSIPPP
jgi:hypothetical protein